MRRLAAGSLIVLGLLVPAAAGAQQTLGRLFFTPEQRETLDGRKKVPTNPSAPISISPTTRLDGVVIRSHGKSTIWMDGNALPDGVRPEGLQVRRSNDPSRVRIGVGEQGRYTTVRVGQQVDRVSGEIKDPIDPGGIKVERRDPPGR